jgi:hypothetical protein
MSRGVRNCSILRCNESVLSTFRPCRGGEPLPISYDFGTCLSYQQARTSKATVWAPELLAHGYGPPLPTPLPAVQATVTSLSAPSIHEYIVEHDKAALNETVSMPLCY